MRKLSCQIILILLLNANLFGQDITAILGAMPQEIAVIDSMMQNKKTVNVLGLNFTTGDIHGRQVVLALSGVGKVNATMTTTLLIEKFKPKCVLFTGIAGGISSRANIGDIILGDSITQYDFGTLNEDLSVEYWGAKSPVNGIRNPIFFKSDVTLLKYAKKIIPTLKLTSFRNSEALSIPKIYNGTLVTGDYFIAAKSKKDQLLTTLKADAVEMEGGAVAQVCYQLNIPFLIVRSISDLANSNAKVDFEKFVPIAARQSGMLIEKLIQQLPLNETSNKSYHKFELYFGLNSQGREISEKEWQSFVDEVITTSFPDGMTILNASGQWRNKEQHIIKEKSKVVILLCKEIEETKALLKVVKRKYCERFNQESVMEVETEIKGVTF